MRLNKTPTPHPSLKRELAREAALGIALGLGFCLLIALIDPSHVTSLIAHNAEPRTTALILVSFVVLTFGLGSTLTGLGPRNNQKPLRSLVFCSRFPSVTRMPQLATISGCSVYVRKC